MISNSYITDIERPDMPLHNLNLVRTFLVLMEEKSVTGAARRLNMTQSAVSNALDRLREQLDDRLLERIGNQMVPSLRARELEPTFRRALEQIDEALAPALDPKQLVGTFRLGIDEYSLALLGPALMEHLRRHSPGISVALITAWPTRDQDLLATGDLDLIVGPMDGKLPGIESEHLFDEEFVGVVAQGHPMATELPVVTERWLAFPHLILSQRGIVPANIDHALDRHGLTRKVGLAIPIMALAPRFLLGTDLIAHVGRRMGAILAARQGLISFDLPIEIPGFQIGLHWHPRNRRAGTHIWVRKAIAEAFGSICT